MCHGYGQFFDHLPWAKFEGAMVMVTRGGGTSSNLGGPLLNFYLQCSLGGASRHLARTHSQVHSGSQYNDKLTIIDL